MEAETSLFDCRMCGHCCEGKGGIVVSPADLTRLAACLRVSPATAARDYCENSGGKLKIRTGDDGYCNSRGSRSREESKTVPSSRVPV